MCSDLISAVDENISWEKRQKMTMQNVRHMVNKKKSSFSSSSRYTARASDPLFEYVPTTVR